MKGESAYGEGGIVDEGIFGPYWVRAGVKLEYDARRKHLGSLQDVLGGSW